MLDWATAAAQALVGVVKVGFDFVRGTRQDANDSQVEAKGKVIESVNESLKTEKEIRKGQSEVGKAGAGGGSGDMKFDNWNNTDTQPLEPEK